MNKGLSLFEVNLVNSFFYVTIFLSEIPTGAFADIFGRKTSFVISCAILALSMMLYSMSHTFWGFVCAEVLGAIGITFKSGAFQAWLVDSLKSGSYAGDLQKVFARENLIRQILSGLFAVLGSYLASKDQSLPWFVGAFTLGITTVVAFFMIKEEYFIRSKFSFKEGLCSMKNVAISSIRYGTKDQTVRFVLIVTSLQVFIVQALNMYWQPFFKQSGLPESHLGFVFTGIQLFIAIGALICSKISYLNKEKKLIITTQVITGLIIIASATVQGLYFSLSLFLIHEITRGMWGPILSSYLHNRIPSEERATIASFCSIAPHIGGAIGLLLSGIIAEKFGISSSWIISGSILIVGSLLLARNHK
jgi:MFS family permease